MCFINWASTFQITRCFTRVDSITMNTSLEKSRAAITAVNSIVFSRAAITTYFAWYIQESITFNYRKSIGKCYFFNIFASFVDKEEKFLANQTYFEYLSKIRFRKFYCCVNITQLKLYNNSRFWWNRWEKLYVQYSLN